MSINVFFDQSNYNVTMICDETTTVEEKVDSIEKIERYLDQYPHANVFVDAREDPVPSPEEEERLGKAMAQHALNYNRHKTAILVKNDLSHVITLTQAYVGGMERIVEFVSEVDARNWLEGSIK